MTERPRHSDRAVHTVLVVAVLSFALLQSMSVPVLGVIERRYGSDQATTTWVLTAYLLAAAVCTPLVGRVGDAVGRVRVLVASLVTVAVGCAVAALAPSIGWLIAARVVQGVGGGVVPLAFGIARDRAGNGARAPIGMIASVAAAGFAVGVVVSGPVIDHLGFRALFWVPMAVTGAAAAAAAVVLTESRDRMPGRVPVPPAVLLATTLVCLLLPVSMAHEWGWDSPWTIGLLVASVVAGAGWVAAERRAAVPLVDLRVLRLRGVWSANVVAAGVGFGQFAALGFLPRFLQTSPAEAGYGFGATVTEASWLLLPVAAMSFLSGTVASGAARRVGARAVAVCGTLMIAGAFVSMGLLHTAPWQLAVATTVQGLGSGLVLATLASVVVTSVPARQTGVASGVNANLRTVGGAAGAAVMGALLSARPGVGGVPPADAYTAGFLLLAIVLVCAAGAAAMLPGAAPQG